MVAKGNSITRKFVGTHSQEVCELPNLVGIQLDSYERFLQLDRLKKQMEPDPNFGTGLSVDLPDREPKWRNVPALPWVHDRFRQH